MPDDEPAHSEIATVNRVEEAGQSARGASLYLFGSVVHSVQRSLYSPITPAGAITISSMLTRYVRLQAVANLTSTSRWRRKADC
jgi:hypothetical protein